MKDGERIVARLLLRSLGPDWSQAHMEKAHKRLDLERRDPSYTYTTKPLQTDGVTMAILGLGALAALRGYLWIQDGETWKAAALGAGTVLGMVIAAWGWWRWKKARSIVHDPLLIKEKVSRIAFDGELQVTAILPLDTGPQRGKELLDPVAAAYRHYDNPAGARFRASKVQPILPNASLHPAGPGLFGGRSILGVREVERRCGTRRERGTRRRWWSVQERESCRPRRGGSGAEPWWETPRREHEGPSISPTTCCADTTSTSQGPAWASPPSCTTWSPTSCGRRRRAGTQTPSSS